MVAPFTKFYGKICVGFCLETEKEQPVEVLNVFNTFNFETDFLENENFFQETTVWCFS